MCAERSACSGRRRTSAVMARRAAGRPQGGLELFAWCDFSASVVSDRC